MIAFSLYRCRNGSVKVDMTLVFKDKNSVPSASNATSQFSSALSDSTSLNVIAGSVSARKLFRTWKSNFMNLQKLIYWIIKCMLQCDTCNSLAMIKNKYFLPVFWTWMKFQQSREVHWLQPLLFLIFQSQHQHQAVLLGPQWAHWQSFH